MSEKLDVTDNVVPLSTARDAALKRRPSTQYLTDEERIELRQMLAWFRTNGPRLERVMERCPTARREIAAMLRGDD